MVLLNKFEFSLPDISQSVDAVAQRLGQWKLFSLQRRPKSTHLHIFQPPRGKSLACLTRRQNGTLHYTQLSEPSNQSPVLNYHFDLINHLTIKLSKMLLDQAISDLGRDQVLSHIIVPTRHLFHNEARHLIDRIANLADFPSGTKATSGKQVHQYTNRLIRTYFLNRETTNILDRIMPANRDAPTIEQYNQTLLNQNLFTNLLMEAPPSPAPLPHHYALHKRVPRRPHPGRNRSPTRRRPGPAASRTHRLSLHLRQLQAPYITPGSHLPGVRLNQPAPVVHRRTSHRRQFLLP